MMTSTEELAAARYALLTTYRKDGRGVGTPVWIVPFDGALAVWTAAASGKVRRIRRDPSVTLATCDMRGNNPGPAHEGRARLLDRAGSAAVLSGIFGVLLGGAVLTGAATNRRLGLGQVLRVDAG